MIRSFRLMLPAALLLVFTGNARADDAEARTIIAKAVKAHGGDTFLEKNKAIQVHNKGKINLPGVGEVEFEQNNSVMLPDKFKESMELNVGGNKVTIVTIANGDKISITANGADVPVTDQIKDAMVGAAHMMKVARLYPLLKDKSYELSLIGESKVEGKAVVGVRVAMKGQKDVSLYFDKETNLTTKIEFRTADPMTGNEITEERLVLEYKKNADGIPLPKKVSVKHDGKVFIEVDVQDMKFLEKLDDSEFKK